MASDLDLVEPFRLSEALVEHGCHCNESLATEWLGGHVVPSFDKMRSIVAALQKAMPERDVWDDFGRLFSERGEGTATADRAVQQDASLEAVLKASPGLPPGLS